MTHGKRAERGRQDGTSRTAQLPLVTQQVVLCTVFFNFKSVELYSNPGSERKADAKRSPHLVDGQQSLPALYSYPPPPEPPGTRAHLISDRTLSSHRAAHISPKAKQHRNTNQSRV